MPVSTPIPDRERYDPLTGRSFRDVATDPQLRITLNEVAAEKRAALADPGPPWKEWALRSALKWYIGLGLLIVDAWIAGFWLTTAAAWAMIPSLGGAVYLEYLVWEYLWYRPREGRKGHARAGRPAKWLHPVPYGRWTLEAELAQHGAAPPPPAEGPDPSEFL